jgi:cold shock protein
MSVASARRNYAVPDACGHFSIAIPGSQVNALSTTGKVKFFNEKKGFGFLLPDDGSQDVFVHRSDLPADVVFLYEGQAVSFDVEKTRRGLRAVNLALVPPA